MTVLAEARGVTKRFGSFTAVHAVNVQVRGGEVVGLLGANGAGKTTLIRLFLGLLHPDGGSVTIFGSAPSPAGRERIGYVPQTLGLYGDLTVAENWSFTAGAFNRPSVALPNEISGWSDDLVRNLPLGIQRQVAFATAFSHDPALLVLDEPTSGVGPLGRARLWEQIRRAALDGLAILVTTHNLEEAEQCDRLVVMADGAVVATGAMSEVVADRMVVEVRCQQWERAYTALDTRGFAPELHGDSLRINAAEATVRDALIDNDIGAEIRRVPANLEEAFVQIVSPRVVS